MYRQKEYMQLLKQKFSKTDIIYAKKGKNIILNNVSDNIENNLDSQVESVEKIDKYIEKWKSYYEEKEL